MSIALVILVYGCSARPGRKAASAPPPTGAPAPPPPVSAVSHAVSVYYGTDRARVAGAYTGKHGDGNSQFGVCAVSIPRDHERGRLETPFMKWLLGADPNRVFSVIRVTPMSEAAWTDDVRQKIEGSQTQDAFVFVHGYNVGFDDACMRTAQLTYDLQFTGVPFMWSWPSEGKTARYFEDEDSVLWTIPHLQGFLERIGQETHARTIHLIAHSMGSRAVVRALAQLAGPQTTLRFNEIILAAPDIDRDNFLQLAEAMKRLSARTTIYVSSHDKAIIAAHDAHHDIRVGEGGVNIVIGPEGMDSVDASALATSPSDLFALDHSYFAEQVLVLDDVIAVLAGKKARERPALTPAKASNNRAYWLMRTP